jgi:type IV pilus assembly protein PilO
MQRSFVVLSNQLPRDTEIPGLILDISEKGLSNGLELELFEPQPENTMDFYAEKPIKIVAKGTYKELATFVSDLSGLPRIVTINNINLTPVENSGRLKLDAMVKTYRYIQEDEDGINEKQIKDKVAGKKVSLNLNQLWLNHKGIS